MIEREASQEAQAGLKLAAHRKIYPRLSPAGLSGRDLAPPGRPSVQATRFGVEISSSARKRPAQRPPSKVPTASFENGPNGSKSHSCHALLLAMGVQWRSLSVPGEESVSAGAGRLLRRRP